MKKTKGFTLIELLIVIAILGILALTLIAAIDPFEQIKKGRDTSLRNTTSEFYNAALRYYANHGVFPWGSSLTTTALSGMSSHVSTLQDAGELKPRFLDLLGDNSDKIFVTSTAAEHIAVCFKPESKAVQTEENTQFTQSGGSASGCKSQPGGTSTDCYWCVQ